MEQALEQYLCSLDEGKDQERRIDDLIDQMHERISRGGAELSTDGLYDEDGFPA